MLRKNVKDFFLIYFKSLKQRQPLTVGLTIIGWVKKIIEMKVKMERRREGKEVGFQGGTYSLKTIYM